MLRATLHAQRGLSCGAVATAILLLAMIAVRVVVQQTRVRLLTLAGLYAAMLVIAFVLTLVSTLRIGE